MNVAEAGQSVGEDSIRHVALKAVRRLTKPSCLSVVVVCEQMSWTVNQDLAALGVLQTQSDGQIFLIDNFFTGK